MKAQIQVIEVVEDHQLKEEEEDLHHSLDFECHVSVVTCYGTLLDL
jgi:hypothetical protein